MFMVLSSLLKATARVHPVHMMNMERHCSKGVQPVPKAVYRSGFFSDKHATAYGGVSLVRILVL